MLKCILLALSGVNWVMLYEEMKYWKMKWQLWKYKRKG